MKNTLDKAVNYEQVSRNLKRDLEIHERVVCLVFRRKLNLKKDYKPEIAEQYLNSLATENHILREQLTQNKSKYFKLTTQN